MSKETDAVTTKLIDVAEELCYQTERKLGVRFRKASAWCMVVISPEDGKPIYLSRGWTDKLYRRMGQGYQHKMTLVVATAKNGSSAFEVVFADNQQDRTIIANWAAHATDVALDELSLFRTPHVVWSASKGD